MSTPTTDSHKNHLPRPPYHPKISAFITALQPNNTFTLSSIPSLRAMTSPTAETAIGSRPIEHLDTSIPSSAGKIPISVFKKKDKNCSGNSSRTARPRPCILHIHGGGTVAGNRYLAVSEILDLVIEYDVVCVSVEYRLAPEHPYPAGLDDCQAVLERVISGAEEFGVDRRKVLIWAGSGGALLAMGLVMRVRDGVGKGDSVSISKGRENGNGNGYASTTGTGNANDQSNYTAKNKNATNIQGLLLPCPMLSHTFHLPSASQYVDGGISDRKSAETYWSWYLGGSSGQYNPDTVPIYASPGSANDFSGLPPTYIDTGSCDVLRDDAVAFASNIWRDGGRCDLHVWEGGCHAFEVLVPDLEISRNAVEARGGWVRRILGV